jgi:hypothetical protein
MSAQPVPMPHIELIVNILKGDLERAEAKIKVLEAWQRGQIAAAVKCQKERTECPVCLDQAARSMSCPECGTMVVRCTEAGVEALDRLASDRAAALRAENKKLVLEAEIRGIRRYAWWKDGVEYVGAGVYTLKDALVAAIAVEAKCASRRDSKRAALRSTGDNDGT